MAVAAQAQSAETTSSIFAAARSDCDRAPGDEMLARRTSPTRRTPLRLVPCRECGAANFVSGDLPLLSRISCGRCQTSMLIPMRLRQYELRSVLDAFIMALTAARSRLLIQQFGPGNPMESAGPGETQSRRRWLFAGSRPSWASISHLIQITMRINNTIPVRSPEFSSSTRRWLHVAVFYDAPTSRDRAAQAEGRLISTLAPIVDLRFAWSSTKCLFHPGVQQCGFDFLPGADQTLPARKLRPEQAAPLNTGMLAAMDRFSSLT